LGSYAQPAIDVMRKAGWSDPAIMGALANGQAEGGFDQPWKQSGYVNPATGKREQSYGHWQFNENGELPGYEGFVGAKGDQQDTATQAAYVVQRMNQINPDYGKIQDPKAATDIFETQFEKPKSALPGQRYPQLAAVMKSWGTSGPQAAPGPQYAQADTGTMTDATPDTALRGPLPPGDKVNSQGVPYNPNEVGANGVKLPKTLFGDTSAGQVYWPTDGSYGPPPGNAPAPAAPPNAPAARAANNAPGGAPPAAAPAAPGTPPGVPSSAAPTAPLPGYGGGGYWEGKIPGTNMTPTQAVAMGAMGEMLGFPNVSQPLLQSYFNSPNFKFMQAQAAAEAENQTKLRYAGAEAAATANAQNQSKLAYATPLAQIKAQYTMGRPSGVLPVFNPDGTVKYWQQAPAAPVVEPNAGVVVQPNTGAATPIGPNYNQGVQGVSTAKAAGPAAFQPVETYSPFGQGYQTTELNLSRALGGGNAPVQATPVGGGLATSLPGVGTPAAPGAPAPAAAPGAPAMRAEAAAPTGTVQTPTGPKDLSQLSMGDMFPGGQGIPHPPAPPAGATYGKPSEAMTKGQEDDATRLEGYQKEASENQKIYQDLAHLQDLLQGGVTTSTMAPKMAELGTLADGMGLGGLIPKTFDPNDLTVFNKASTDLVFAAVKKLAGAVKVAEIEGYKRASPNWEMPVGANMQVINDLLAQGKWQDARARLATEYYYGTGGAPLGTFDAKFNQMAPLVNVTNDYKSLIKNTPQYKAGLQRGVGFPEDLRPSGNAGGEGLTATNPANGHRIIVKGGQWTDMETGQPIGR
jgi:hypothetical protein